MTVTPHRIGGKSSGGELPERVARLEEKAVQFDGRQDRHDDDCSERYASLDGQMVRVHGRIDRILYLQLGGLLSTVLTLVGVTIGLLRAHP